MKPSPEQLEINRALRKRRVGGLLENRPATGPQTVHFDIANGCNTRCTTCWHHSPLLNAERVPSITWKRRQLPFESFKSILADLRTLGGLEQIILSGMGEPFLNPEIYRMVEEAHRYGIGVTIITNLLLADLPRLLASGGELNLLTSICGVTAPVWQAFHAHPRPDGFARLEEQLAFLCRWGFRPKHVQVINQQNFDQLVQMVEFARRFPVKRINFKFASLLNGTQAVALNAAEKEQLLTHLIPAARARAQQLEIDTDLDAFAQQVDPTGLRTAPIEGVGCFMGFLYCRITVDLELLFCCNTNLQVGSLANGESMRELWYSAEYQQIRDSLRRGTYFKGCQMCGKFKQNLKWSRKLRRSLPEARFLRLLGQPPPGEQP